MAAKHVIQLLSRGGGPRVRRGVHRESPRHRARERSMRVPKPGNCSEDGVFSQNLGVGIGIGVGIEMAAASDLDSESDTDPDTDCDQRRELLQMLFTRMGAPQAHGLLSPIWFKDKPGMALSLCRARNETAPSGHGRRRLVRRIEYCWRGTRVSAERVRTNG